MTLGCQALGQARRHSGEARTAVAARVAGPCRLFAAVGFRVRRQGAR
jgi:hypothetical protein